MHLERPRAPGEGVGYAKSGFVCRHCDDWGRWFGNNNSRWVWHYPIPEHYLTRNPTLVVKSLKHELADYPDASRVFPAMREIVQTHQARGHTVVLSSSALTIHAEPVARYLEINHVLCNHFELDEQGLLTGRVAKPVVWGRKKATAVQEFCDANDVDLQRSYFYADGDEDAALMHLVGQPRPVNPRPGLAAIAAENRWPVLQVIAAGGRRRRSLRRLVGYD